MKSSQTLEKLIVFTRYPEPGKTKTRLVPALGDLKAADTQRMLTERTTARVRQLLQVRDVDVDIYFAGGDLRRMQGWLGTDLNFIPQSAGGLGKRLAEACAAAFKSGFKRVVVIGSDCPGLEIYHLEQAFAALIRKDIVIGPAADGGYYLIGMNREIKKLFSEIPWSTEAVYETTVRIAEKADLTIETLAILNDVDRPEDLTHIDHYPGT